MSHKVNLVRVLTAATGNSTPITLGAAYSQLFMLPSEAGAMDGRVYTYLIVDGNNWELGRGVYTASGTTLARTTIIASRNSGTLGASRISLTGTAQVRFIESAEDMDGMRGTRAVTGTSDTLNNSDLGYAVTYSNASAVAVSLAQASVSNLFLDGWAVWVKNKGAGAITITPATSTIDGAATLVLAQNQGALIWSDGTNYQAFRLGTPVVGTTAGTVAAGDDARFVHPVVGGYFTYVSATSVQLQPFNGDSVRINGSTYQIPGGSVSLSNSGLSASTLYYIYVYMNAGTMTLEASTTGYVIDTTAGNVGTMIKSGNSSRTLVGMLYTSSSTTFLTQLVISWFNKKLKKVSNTSVATSSGATALVDFLTWVDQAVSVSAQAFSTNSTATAYLQGRIEIDGAGVGMTARNDIVTSTSGASIHLTDYLSLTVGYHTAGINVLMNGSIIAANQEVFATYWG